MSPGEPAEQDDSARISAGAETWRLRLYVAGRTPRSLKAFENLKRVCEASLGAGAYEIEVVDLQGQPSLASTEQILAVPTVVKAAPGPVRRVIGDLSDSNRVLAGLGIERRRPR
jgi:circadian clock protein KaiB